MQTKTKNDVMKELKQMLHDVLAATAAGTTQARIARAHGYVDGYMRALLTAGVATRAELLDLVAKERAGVAGPATRVLDPNELVDGVAAA